MWDCRTKRVSYLVTGRKVRTLKKSENDIPLFDEEEKQFLKQIIILLLIVGLLLSCVTTAVILVHRFRTASPAPGASDGTQWHGKQAIEHQIEVKQIAIPGIDKLYFVANQTEQQVNIYNPDTNDCEIKFTLEVDGETLWQSAECSPGYGFYTINLSKPLAAGTYKGTLLHECSRNCKELNSARMNLEIIVE